MSRNFVLTLTGPDRIGIVEAITRRLLDHGGNVETSRMARLGGEFAVLMLVSMPAEPATSLETALQDLVDQGYKVTATPTTPTYAEAHPGWATYRIEVQGADHEGIIHRVSHRLSQSGISIESLETETIPAPITGAPLFTMTALVVVPPSLADRDWKPALDEMGRQENLEIGVMLVESH